MGIRDITDKALALLEQGKSKREVYASLTATSPDEAGKIAYCIASIPDDSLRKKYIRHNAALCILLVVYAIVNVLAALPVKPGEPTLFIFLTSAVPLVLSYFVYRFHGGVYRFAGIWFLVDLLETVLLKGVPDGIAVIRVLTLFFIVTLTFFLARKVFPQLGILGPKKDGSGHFEL